MRRRGHGETPDGGRAGANRRGREGERRRSLSLRHHGRVSRARHGAAPFLRLAHAGSSRRCVAATARPADVGASEIRGPRRSAARQRVVPHACRRRTAGQVTVADTNSPRIGWMRTAQVDQVDCHDIDAPPRALRELAHVTSPVTRRTNESRAGRDSDRRGTRRPASDVRSLRRYEKADRRNGGPPGDRRNGYPAPSRNVG